MNEEEIEKLIDERIKKVVPDFLKSQAFIARKLTDTPTDRYQVTPMGYVNFYGSTIGSSSTIGRPIGSVIGQQYFDTDLGYPIFKNQNTRWVSATGSVVG